MVYFSNCHDHCHYFPPLVGLFRPWDFEHSVPLVLGAKPDPAATLGIWPSIVGACSIGIYNYIFMSVVLVVISEPLCQVIGDVIWVSEDPNAFR